MIENETYKNLDVLEFYKELPFNIYSSPEAAIKNLKNNDNIKIYPPLSNIIKNNNDFKILDLGCGAGWFANSISYKFKQINVTGIDFNPIAINFAKKVKEKLNLKTKFIVEDLFKINFNEKFDLITSLGVLHHTNNCLKGIEKIIQLSPRFFLIGLYHKYGRKPFLDHFNSLKLKFKNLEKKDFENALFEEYKKIDKRDQDQVHLKSWFKDQVLHPHETQHTLSEIISIIKPDFKIISTSLNRFEEIKNLDEILNEEKKWYDYGLNKLLNKIYFPGFFIVCCEKI